MQRRINLGSLSGNFTIMDATSASCLPPGVSSTRLPTWLFPSNFDEHTRLCLRPDILIIEGLPLATFLAHKSDLESLNPTGLAFLHQLKQKVKIHIIELGFTSDASHTDSLSCKCSQHNHLVSHLISSGWKLATSIIIHIIPTHSSSHGPS